jgi:hypothetical protein
MKKIRTVGVISHAVAERFKLYEYENKHIVQSSNLCKHTVKHKSEFKNVDSYYLAFNSIPRIIAKLTFVFYDERRESLLYFKKIEENVCVVVKLSLSKNIYVATMYPVGIRKMQKLMHKERYK